MRPENDNASSPAQPPRSWHEPGSRSGPPWAWRHDNGEKPEWWPNDLAWPPDENAWRINRRRMMRRLAMGLTIFGFFVATLVTVIMASITGSWDHAGKFRGVMIFFLIALTFGIIKISRGASSFFTFADVMNAADRVATGDYTVRVADRGKGEARKLAESFNTMVERLAENDAQRRAFFADIAHELRTPLSVVRGTIEAMLDDVYPTDTEHLAPLLDEIAVITRLLEDLQLVATAEAGGLKLHRETVDVGELAADLVAAFRPKASAAGIELRCEIPEAMELSIDPVRIRQVLENLLSNALRYTPANGTVTISATATSGDTTISIADTGIGMTDEQRARMFDRFVKSADSGGSGLGLSIAKSLVEAHGGKIWASSTRNGGTTVSLSLPRLSSQ